MNKSFDTNYKKITAASKEIATLSSIEALLSWDLETYMPSKGGPERANQSALISSLIHEKKVDESFKNLLNKLIDLKTGKYKKQNISFAKKASLREWRRDYIIETKLPKKLVEELAKSTSEGAKIWSEAKEKKSFTIFKPYLEKIIKLCREKAEIIGYESHPYDALMDLFEPGSKVKTIDPIFSELKKGLVGLIEKIMNKDFQIKTDFLKIPTSEEIQLKLSKKIMNLMGLFEDFSRIDKSAHPFSSSLNPNDIRMTTRFDINNFISNIFVTLHEGGHCLYDKQLPKKHFGTPLCQAVSYGLHESQSRFWETIIGKSLSFWKMFYPEIKKEITHHFDKVSLFDFYKAINKVSPTFIRVEADELTYCLHIILRYEIEKDLISNDISVSDIPSAWNEKMKKFLNILPSSDELGCLQDIHWSLAYFGYFPSYALGNIYASCFYMQFKKDNPNFQSEIQKGNLGFICKWLEKNIHRYGRQYSSEELIKKVTYQKFSHQPYLNYLNEKYSDIYEL